MAATQDDGGEAQSAFGTDLVRIQIKMNRSFSAFDEKQKAAYLADLANVAGCTPVQFHRQIFIRGCVKHEFEVPRAIAKRLLTLFEQARKDLPAQGSDTTEAALERQALEAFHQFMAAHFVDSVTAFSTLTIQVTENAPRKAAIFVHGWRGTADSFGSMPGWIQEQTGWETGVFTYPTGLWSNSPSISLVAAALDNWVRAHFDGSTLAIIGHSMGGVVVRKMITEQVISDEPLNVRLAVMCASPHTGTLASLLRLIPTLGTVQLRELDQDSTFLFDLNKYWNWWVHKHSAGAITTKSVIAQQDGVVALNSAAGLDSAPLVVLGADHRSVVKPGSAKDLTVARMASWINAIT